MSLLTLCFCLAAACYFDIRFGRIPNWLVAAGVVCGLVLNGLLPTGLGMVVALQGLGLGLLLLLPLYVLRAMGAGDVKLMGMVGAFVGPQAIIGITLLTFLAGGVMALVVAVGKGRFMQMLGNIRMVLQNAMIQASVREKPEIDVPQSVGKLPYAVAIAAGTLLFLFWRQW